MHSRTFGRIGAALAGAAISTLAFAGTAHAAAKTIVVPDDFNPAYSDTRDTGHYEVQGTGLHIWTEGNTGPDKVAEYVDTVKPLADVGEPALDYTDDSGHIPPGLPARRGLRQRRQRGRHPGRRADLYGNDWWLSNGSEQFVKDGAPVTRRGFRQRQPRHPRPVAGQRSRTRR